MADRDDVHLIQLDFGESHIESELEEVDGDNINVSNVILQEIEFVLARNGVEIP